MDPSEDASTAALEGDDAPMDWTEFALVASVERIPVLPSEEGAPETCSLPFVDRSTTKSAECMTCHDGSRPGAFEVRHDVSHRMDFDYADLLAARHDMDLVPVPRLVLPEGKVTCTTCHDAGPALKDWIALPNKELCLSCHRMN